jgi:hypothetical protein
MANSDRFSSAASQAKVQAGELAATARQKADELITKATPVVNEAAEKAGQYAAKAGVAAAGHVDGVAAGLKSATSGRGAEKIDALGSKLKQLLDPNRPGPASSPEHPEEGGSTEQQPPA